MGVRGTMVDGQIEGEGVPSPLPPEPTDLPAWIPWAWMFLILVACWIPLDRIKVSESATQRKIPYVDKIVHFGLFAVYGVLGRRSRGVENRALVTVGLGVVLAVVSEVG